MIGNNSCGAHSAAYGKTVDNLEALEVLLYDGTHLSLTARSPRRSSTPRSRAAAAKASSTRSCASFAISMRDSVRAHFPKLPRRVSGYNLDELMPENDFNVARAMVGSEGTLGHDSRATVRAVPRPKEVVLVVLGFDDVFIAADQMWWLLAHRPEALEGFDENLPEFARIKEMPGCGCCLTGAHF